MSELALELISEAKEKRLTRLDLGKCGLLEPPKQLYDLVWLEELILSNEWDEFNTQDAQWHRIYSANEGASNRINHISGELNRLTKLKRLNLSDNEISDLSPLSTLNNLTFLGLRSNEIKDLAPISKLKSLTVLDLSRTSMESEIDLKPISALNNLTTLDISENRFSDLKPISALSNLTWLSLEGNPVEDLEPIATLRNLVTLDITYTHIRDLTPIRDFKKLVRLHLSNSKFISDLKPISGLNNLTSLDFSQTDISNLQPISGLNNLRSLDFSKTSVSDLNAISVLHSLTSLDFSHTPISDLNAVSNLSNLASLDFPHTFISDLHSIAGLNNLASLDLSHTSISDLHPISGLNNLTSLRFSHTPITDLTPISSLSNLTLLHLVNTRVTDLTPIKRIISNGSRVSLESKTYHFEQLIAVHDTPLERPPISIVEQGNSAILSYFYDLENQGKQALNEAKLIVVGEPEAGKTTLVETLLDPSFELTTETQSTLGIKVHEGWKFSHPDKLDTLFTANIWDFGGQQIQYMTHQFFLTPGAVYVLVSANDRKEPTNFPYWFKIIHLLGEERGVYSPVLVVLNEKNDKFVNKFNFDLKFYQERYPELQISVREVDLSSRDGNYQALRSEVKKMLTRLPHVIEPRPARWEDIRTTLRGQAKSDDHIDFSQYSTICSEHTVVREDSQLLFSSYLHRLGSLLHFADDPILYNFIILNPQWAVDAVYSILNDNQITKDGGYFTLTQVEAIWSVKQDKNGLPLYNHGERRKLLNLMEKDNFEICYPLDSSAKTYIAPQLLDTEQPDYDWDTTDCLKFRFQHKFMPEGVLTRLIVRMNALITLGNDGKGLVWRKGVLLSSEGCQAQVLEEENRDGLKVIDIAVTGRKSERKYLLREIRKEIHNIYQKWFRNIQFEQMIPCNCESCLTTRLPTYFEFSELQQYQDEGEEYIKCRKVRIKSVEVLLLLEGVFDSQELKTHETLRRNTNRGTRAVINLINKRKPAIHEKKRDWQPKIGTNSHANLISKSVSEKKWYQEWWLASLVVALLVGGLVGFWFKSLSLGLVAVAGVGYFVNSLSSKRRFWRGSLLAFIWLMLNASPPLALKLGWIDQSATDKKWFLVESGDPLNIALSIGVLALIAWWSWLDHKQN